ncbi:HGGxSTG domain-containing protein [Shewanella glacialipiscicola]|uniref:HGGxSTG domain-containing protein n=1 Tax=Shewanella glacialipiscicola TaxID=614069 RepID=UPI003D7908F3
MSRFNLETLPRCGAKTRSGNQCQRYGNKTNGRCKLHGGRSTGAKTKEGKLAVRVNSLVNCLIWYFDNRFDLKMKKSDLNIAIMAYLKLSELSHLKSNELNDEIIDIVDLYRIELEMNKYYIAHHRGPEALLIIQSALDHYYKDTASQHLRFHVHTAVYPTPFYNRVFGSKTEIAQEIQIIAKNIQKKEKVYSSRNTSSPVKTALKKYINQLKNE